MKLAEIWAWIAVLWAIVTMGWIWGANLKMSEYQEQKVYYEETIKTLEAENQKLKETQLIVPKIVASIAFHETHQGKTGKGRSHCNNPTGIAGKCFSSLLEGYRYSVDLWERKYAHLPIRTALKTWKVGSQPWTPEVDEYIQDITSKI